MAIHSELDSLLEAPALFLGMWACRRPGDLFLSSKSLKILVGVWGLPAPPSLLCRFTITLRGRQSVVSCLGMARAAFKRFPLKYSSSHHNLDQR